MTAPRLLQFGTDGQLATELMRAAVRQNVPLRTITVAEANFERPEDVAAVVDAARDVDVVVNAAAYTAVDKAESQEELARTINATAVSAMAAACARKSLPLIHVSTDYVYDGTKASPYVETDPTNPVGAYGRTKLEGEDAIRAALPAHVILRTSWVYSSVGANFVKTMLRLGAERDVLNVVDDQHGAPTAAGDLAAAIIEIARQLAAGKKDFGVFHYAGGGTTTWHGFAQAIFDSARGWGGIKANAVPITTAEYPTPARRPANSSLDCSKIEQAYSIKPVPWETALARVLEELREQPAV